MVLLEERQTRGFESVRISVPMEKRIAWLNPGDRQLLQLSLRGTLSRREMALLMGQSSGSVTRRLRRILERLNDPVVVALVENGKLLPELHQEVGLAYFLRARTIRQIGAEFDVALYQVRRILEYVRGWFGGRRG